MKVLAVVVFFLVGCSGMKPVDRCDPVVMEKGFYFGQSGSGFSRRLIFVKNEEEVSLEIYYPFKCEFFKIVGDTLYPNQGSPSSTLYVGERTSIVCKKSKLFVTQTEKKPKDRFKDTPIALNPGKEMLFHECKNRAFDFQNLRETAQVLAKEFIENDTVPEKYAPSKDKYGEGSFPHVLKSKISSDMSLLFEHKYQILELARTLPHDEFLIIYEEIRKKIIQEITGK